MLKHDVSKKYTHTYIYIKYLEKERFVIRIFLLFLQSWVFFSLSLSYSLAAAVSSDRPSVWPWIDNSTFSRSLLYEEKETNGQSRMKRGWKEGRMENSARSSHSHTNLHSRCMRVRAYRGNLPFRREGGVFRVFQRSKITWWNKETGSMTLPRTSRHGVS